MDARGAPTTVEESRELGRAAVFAVLAVARGCLGAVIDSTWHPYFEPLVGSLPGPAVGDQLPGAPRGSGTATGTGTNGTWTGSVSRRPGVGQRGGSARRRAPARGQEVARSVALRVPNALRGHVDCGDLTASTGISGRYVTAK